MEGEERKEFHLIASEQTNQGTYCTWGLLLKKLDDPNLIVH